MQILIEIPEEEYIATKVMVQSHNIGSANDRVIANGTPLPEHHERLIEDNVIADEFVYGKDDPYYIATSEWLKAQPTIIPAMKEEKHCKACTYSDNGMINVESERCKACYYDGKLGGNCLFVSKQTATKEGDGE